MKNEAMAILSECVEVTLIALGNEATPRQTFAAKIILLIPKKGNRSITGE